MKNFKHLLGIILVGSIFVSCSDSDDDNTNSDEVSTGVSIKDAKAAKDKFVEIVSLSYETSLESAKVMQTAIDAFVADPSEQTHSDAKIKWLAAREHYGQTEVYRGGWGPIDSEGGESWAIANEGQMNAWPLDEGYIDYVKSSSAAYAGSYGGGIIAGSDVITKTLLASKNEGGNGFEGDDDAAGKAISTGWHAIEFLLWGQDETDPDQKIPGQRSYTDYVIAEVPVAAKSNTSVVPSITNQERRGDYLKVVTALLIDDLTDINSQWVEGGEFRTYFTGLNDDDFLRLLFNGPFFLASSELSVERLIVPASETTGIDASGQENEHSCFADNTHRDAYTNALGIINVLYGKYADGNIDEGASIYTLTLTADPAQAAKLKLAADAALAAVKAISDKVTEDKVFFDEQLQNETEENPGLIFAAGQKLKDLGDEISAAANNFNIVLASE